MKKLNDDTKLEAMGNDIYSLGFSIDTLCYIVDTFEPLKYLHDNNQFMQIDDIYRSLLTKIAALIKALPSQLVSDADTALTLLPASLFKLWEIDDRWHHTKSLLLSTRSQTQGLSHTKRLRIDDSLYDENVKTLNAAEKLVNEYFSVIESNNTQDTPIEETVSEPVYTLKYDHISGRIYVNDLLIQRTQVDRAPDIVMSRVIKSPNKLISFDDERAVNINSFINNLRIPSELCDLFFPRRGRKSLQLAPIITKAMAKDNNLDIDSLNRELENIAYTE